MSSIHDICHCVGHLDEDLIFFPFPSPHESDTETFKKWCLSQYENKYVQSAGHYFKINHNCTNGHRRYMTTCQINVDVKH